MNKAPASDAKENLIKARFDDEVYEQILAQCRRLKLRRAVLVRQIVQAWLESQPADLRAQITPARKAA
ncbi:TPA: hypothetical protein ACXJUT_001963 [Pseudomonas aeruginosa]